MAGAALGTGGARAVGAGVLRRSGAAIADDLVAQHLVHEPRESWVRDTSRRQSSFVRAGVLAAGAVDRAHGRVGMIGVVSAYQKWWLWEIGAKQYYMRSFSIGDDGTVALGDVLAAGTARAVVDAAGAGSSAKYSGEAIFGICEHELRERFDHADLTVNGARQRGEHCCSCQRPFADDVGQVVDGVRRFCALCVTAEVQRDRTARAEMHDEQFPASRDQTVVEELAMGCIIASVSALGNAFAPFLCCEQCKCDSLKFIGIERLERRDRFCFRFGCTKNDAHRLHITTGSVPSAARQELAQVLTAGMFAFGVAFSQLENTLQLLGAALPVGRSMLFERGTPALGVKLANIRNEVLDGRARELAQSREDLTVGIDATWSHRRSARESTAIALDARTGRLLEAQHLVLCPSPVLKAQAVADRRLALPRCSSKALEGAGVEMCASRLCEAGANIDAVVKDDDSTSLTAVRKFYPDASERLDTNHVLKSFEKAVRTAARNIPDLRGRAEQMRAHLQRIFRNASTNPACLDDLLQAFVAHMGGDHAICPTAVNPRGASFHCPHKCDCDVCGPMLKAREKDITEHPRVQRFRVLGKAVRACTGARACLPQSGGCCVSDDRLRAPRGTSCACVCDRAWSGSKGASQSGCRTGPFTRTSGAPPPSRPSTARFTAVRARTSHSPARTLRVPTSLCSSTTSATR